MKKQTILIVDDESRNISILVEILGTKYNLLVATDGATALEIANSDEAVDLILLDIVMPEMDGYEVAYELKHTKKTSKIPFIFLTAKSDSQSVVKGFLEGAADYISKPFAKEELLARVHNHLQLHALNSELLQNKNFLQTSEERLRFALEGSGDGLWDWDLKTNEVFFSKRWKEMLGFKEDEIANTLEEWKNRVHPQDLEQVYADVTAHIEGKSNVYLNEHRVKCKDGSYKWILDRGMIVSRDVDGSPLRMVGSHSDISERKQSQLKLEEYLLIIDKNVISSKTDLDGIIVEVSEAFCKLTGYSREELIGKNHNILRHVDVEDSAYKILWETITKNEEWKGEVKNRRKDGSIYWVNATVFPLLDEENTKIGYMAIRQDITDKKRIEELSIKDELTKLYNRRYFNEVFSSELNRVKRENRSLSFLMIDVDYFKAYNDTYGHQAGDNVLTKVGEVLNTFSKRAGDFAFRLGGEEFGIIVHEDNPEEVTKFANNLLKAIEALKIPHAKNLVSEFVTVSIGLVYKNIDKTTTVEMLYKEVDDCLYRAKESGRNRVVQS